MDNSTVITAQKPAVASRKAQAPAANPGYLAAQWDEASLVYPIYSAIARKFSLGELCADLESGTKKPRAEQVQCARRWLDEMDQLIQVHQFRQFLQSAQYQNPREDGLRALVLRHLLRPRKSPADCDKIDFLLVQYFALCAPEGMSSGKIDMSDVAKVLKPVIGSGELRTLEWFDSLEALVQALPDCQSLRDLMETGFLEQGRQLKSAAGDMVYDPSSLVAFVRFNFLVRRTFIRLMHADLHAIREGLRQLAPLGIRSIDCTAAGLSSEEPIARLDQFCAEWKQPFARSYSENSVAQSFGKLLSIRAAVTVALERRPARAAARPASQPEAAASSGAQKKTAKPAAPPATPAPAAKLKPAAPVVQSKPAAQTQAAAQAKPAAPAKPAPQVPAAQPAQGANGQGKSPAQKAPAAAPARVAPTAAVAAKSPAAPPAAPPEDPEAAGIDPEDCMETIWEQLIETPPSRGRSMTSVTYQSTKMLLSAWEVAAFVSDGGQISEDLRHGVVARLLVSVASESLKRSGKFPGLEATLALAHSRAAKLQESVEHAKSQKNTEAAVNLSITAKRLLAYIEDAEGLRS